VNWDRIPQEQGNFTKGFVLDLNFFKGSKPIIGNLINDGFNVHF